VESIFETEGQVESKWDTEDIVCAQVEQCAKELYMKLVVIAVEKEMWEKLYLLSSSSKDATAHARDSVEDLEQRYERQDRRNKRHNLRVVIEHVRP